MKAIGYFREAAEGSATLAQQNKAFLDYCQREGLESAGTFADSDALANGGNGNGRGQQGFRQMLALLRSGERGFVVVVPSLAMLGGDLSDIARKYFQIEGLGVHIAPMSAADDPASDLITLWTANDQSAKIGDRVRAAMRRKAVKGEVLGRPPYGYKVGNRRRLELIPEEAVVVRYIFRLYLQEGLGIRLIARRLNEEGLKTRRGGNWSMVSIRDILRNRVYLGTYSRFGVRVPGSHPPLVSTEDFRAVEDRLNARRTSYNPRVTSQFLLSGIAHCGYCENKLIGVSRKQSWKRASGERIENSYRYYQCESRTNQSVCNYHTRRADALEAEVRAALPAATEAVRAAHPEGDHRDAAAVEGEHERLRSRLKSIDKRIEKYIDAAARGTLTREKMLKQCLAAAADRQSIDDAIAAADRRIGSATGDADRASELRAAVTRLAEEWETLSFAERQGALREAVTRITVKDDAVTVALRV